MLLVTGGVSLWLLSLQHWGKFVTWQKLVSISFHRLHLKISFLMLVIRNIAGEALTTRWPFTPVAAKWRSGGRWREENFLQQGQDHEPPWSAISSFSLVVPPLTPPSCPGTQLPSPGNPPETLLSGDVTMPPLLFRIRLLIVSFKPIEKHWTLIGNFLRCISQGVFFLSSGLTCQTIQLHAALYLSWFTTSL